MKTAGYKVSLRKAALEFRGKGAREIADLLAEAGIKGVRGTVRGCPLAEYCHREFGGTFVVGKKHVYRVRHIKGENVVSEKIATPANMAEFIARFDLGDYPLLVKPSPRRKQSPDHRTGNRHKKPITRYPRKSRYELAKEVGRF